MANNSILPPDIQLKNIVEIGNMLQDGFANQMTFNSDDYLLDADVLLISISALQLEFSQLMYVDGIATYYMSQEKFRDFEKKIEQRKKQLQQYLDRGGILFVFIDNDPLYSYKFDKGENSRDMEFDFLDIVMLNSTDYKIESVRGTNIIFTNEIYLDFFQPWDISYQFIYKQFKGIATAKVKNTGQAISVRVPKGKGIIMLLPDLKLSADDYNDYENRLREVRIAILNFVRRFEDNKPQIQEIGLPKWCDNYYLGDEIEKVSILEKLQIELAETHQTNGNQCDRVLYFPLYSNNLVYHLFFWLR